MAKCPRRLIGLLFTQAHLSRGAFPHCRGIGRAAGAFCFVLLLSVLGRLSPGQAGPSSQPAVAGLKSGVQALFAGDFAKAESIARQQLVVNSRSVEALVLLGRTREAVNLGPGMPLTHHQLGIVLAKKKRYSDAIDELKRATELDPAYPEAHLTLAHVYRQRGEKEKTEAELSTFQRLKQAQKDRDATAGSVQASGIPQK